MSDLILCGLCIFWFIIMVYALYKGAVSEKDDTK